MALGLTMLKRGGLLALSLAAGVALGASGAIAQTPPPGWPGPGFEDVPAGDAWMGLYAGLHVGGIDAWWDGGFVGGVHVGKSWQNYRVVYGWEADLSASAADDINWLATVRGRLGVLLSPGLLVYGSTGIGFVDWELGGVQAEFVYGVGLESKLSPETTLRAEYIGYSDSDIDLVRVGVSWKLGW